MKSIFETKEQYLQFKSAWKKTANTKKLSSTHFALYAVIMEKDILKTFTPVTNKTKLSCSCMQMPYFNAHNALSYIEWIAERATKGETSRQFEWTIKPHFGDVISVENMGKLYERIIKAKNELSVQENVIRKQLGLKEW